MSKICTSIEQSKKLIELGIDVNTADMSYHPIMDIDTMDFTKYLDIPSVIPFSEVKNSKVAMLPAWSLSALLGLMPFHIIENNRFGFYQVKGYNKQGETYRFGYKTNNDSFLFETSWHDDVVDAAFEMICWLKENNKI